MAAAISHPHMLATHTHCAHHHHHSSFLRYTNSSISGVFNRRHSCAARMRAIPESQDPEPPIRLGNLNLSAAVDRLRDAIKIDELGLDILSIALPAALALVADPITSLVDTAFVGHLVELAAVGVSVSVFNFVSKLFNVPLLNITTSFVAEEQALIGKEREFSSEIGQNNSHARVVLPSVSASLALAAGIGFVEAAALLVGSGFLMNIMGISVDSTIRMPAELFLRIRAFGAPPIIVALAVQGAFRGFKDTKTPLFAIGKYNGISFFISVLAVSIDLKICLFIVFLSYLVELSLPCLIFQKDQNYAWCGNTLGYHMELELRGKIVLFIIPLELSLLVPVEK